jgi:hypothetical protein
MPELRDEGSRVASVRSYDRILARKTGSLITYPRSGHGPHHQYSEAAATQIAVFINGTK